MLAFRQDLFYGKYLYIKLKLSNGRIGYGIYFFATWCIKYFFDLKLKIATALSDRAPAPCVFFILSIRENFIGNESPVDDEKNCVSDFYFINAICFYARFCGKFR